MFTDVEKEAIRRSWRLVIPIAETAADLFYKRLFELRPEYRSLFTGDITAQKRKLVKMLAFIVKAMDWADEDWQADVDPNEDLMLVVLAMGRRHTKLYKIPDESYGTVGEALLWTLDYGLGDAFTPQVKAAWVRLYTLLAQTMRMGSVAVPETETQSVNVDTSQRHGEEALMGQMTAAGIDEVRLGLEDS